MCISTTTNFIPPYVVYKGERPISDTSHTTYGGPRFTVSHSGWMTEETFLDWMGSQFIACIPDEHPILLILDGHSSHISYEIHLLAIQHKIHLLKLSPHTTRGLQHTWCCCNKPHKRNLAGNCRRVDKGRTKDHCKEIFSSINGVWKQYKTEWGVAAFHKCGIVPFNEEVIPESLFSYSEPFSCSYV